MKYIYPEIRSVIVDDELWENNPLNLSQTVDIEKEEDESVYILQFYYVGGSKTTWKFNTEKQRDGILQGILLSNATKITRESYEK